MATLRQNFVARPSELRSSVLETALDMGIQNETVAKWIFESVVEEEEEEEVEVEDTSISSPSLTTASTAASIVSNISQPSSFKPYENSLGSSILSNPYDIEFRVDHAPESLLSGSMSASLGSDLHTNVFTTSSPSKKQRWQGLKIKRQPEPEAPVLKLPEGKEPIEYRRSKKQGINSVASIAKRDLSPAKGRVKVPKLKSKLSEPTLSPAAPEGYESDGQALSPNKRKEKNEKTFRSLGRRTPVKNYSRDDPDQGYLSDGAALTPSKRKKSFFRFERKTPSIPDLRTSSNASTSAILKELSKPHTPPPLPPAVTTAHVALPIAERFARMRMGVHTDFIRVPSTSDYSQTATSITDNTSLTKDIWNDTVLLGTKSSEKTTKTDKAEENDRESTSTIASPITGDSLSSISSRVSVAAVETTGSNPEVTDKKSGFLSASTTVTPFLARKVSKRKITPADISLPTTHFVDFRTSPSTQSSISPASDASLSTSSSSQDIYGIDSDPFSPSSSLASANSNRPSPQIYSPSQMVPEREARGRPHHPLLSVIPPTDETPSRTQGQISPRFDRNSSNGRTAPASLLAYYGLPPPSPPPLGPLPSIPPQSLSDSGPGINDQRRRRGLSPLRPQANTTSRSRSPIARESYSPAPLREKVGLFSQPIPTIRRGRELPFPAEPILPPEDSHNLIQKSVLPALKSRIDNIGRSRSPSHERDSAFFRSLLETTTHRTSWVEDWPTRLLETGRSDDVYDEDDDASYYTSDDRTASRSTIALFDDEVASIYSRHSILNPERSAEIRKRFLKRTIALFGPDGRELEEEIPPVPPLPAGIALGYPTAQDYSRRF